MIQFKLVFQIPRLVTSTTSFYPENVPHSTDLPAGRGLKECFWSAMLIGLTCLAYLPVLHAGFVWDDVYMVTDNQMLRSTQGLHDLWFTTRFADPYRITMSAFWLQWQLWGNNPLGYHIVNVLMHAFGCVLLWRVLQKLAVPGAWLAATAFAVHPVCVASVAWVSELKNTCSLIFYLLTLLYYFRFKKVRQRRWYALALVAYICAIMSKGSVVMLPIIILLITWWQKSRVSRNDFLAVAPFLTLSFAAGLMTIWFQNHRAIGGEEVQNLAPVGRLAGAAWAIWFYLWKSWGPINLNVIYPQWNIDASSALDWIPGILLSAVLAICWKNRTSWGKHVLFGLGYFIITLFPVMGFFNMYLLVYCRVVDHWQYLALPGSIAMVTSAGVAWVRSSSKRNPALRLIGPMTAAVLLGTLSILTWIRAEVYTSEEKLWSDTVRKNPNAWMAFNNLGNALGARGKSSEAIEHYYKALKLKPDFADAHSNLGNALVAIGKVDEAIEHLETAVHIQPRMPTFQFNYGVALAEKGRLDEAIQAYLKALEIKPRYSDAYNNIANVLLKQNKPKEAYDYACKAIELKRDSPEAEYNLAAALEAMNRTQDALPHLELALRLRPDFIAAHYDLGLALATSGRLQEALPHFQEMVRLKPDQAVGHTSVATALASLKRFDEAIVEFRTALQLQPDDAQTHYNLATALIQQGKIQDALPHYEKALALRPGDVDTRWNFAWALTQAGRKADALAQYQAALKARPNDPRIQEQMRILAGKK